MNGAGESTMPHHDEGLIHAWLDGELDAAEAARVEALVATDPAWAAAAADARGLVAASSRIVRALDDVPARVIPARTGGSPVRAPRLRMMRVAALLLVVAGTAVVLRERDAAIVIREAAPTPRPGRETGPAKAIAAPVEQAPSTPAAATATAEKSLSPSRRTGNTLAGARASASEVAAPAAPTVKAEAASADAPSPPVRAASVTTPRDERAARSMAERAEMKDAPLLLSTPAGLASYCYVVRPPSTLAGRMVVHPADSGSRAMWAAVGINSDSLIARTDSLLGPAPGGDRKSATRIIAVRTPCPSR